MIRRVLGAAPQVGRSCIGLLVLLLLLNLRSGSARLVFLTAMPSSLPFAVGFGAGGTATPGAGSVAAGPTAVISEAYQDLEAKLVLPVSSSTLLGAAWQAVVAEARQEGVTVSEPIAGDPGTIVTLEQFQKSYLNLLRQRGEVVDRSRLQAAALTAMAEAVNDCHTAYLTAGEYQSVSVDLQGQGRIPSLPFTFELDPPFLVTSVVRGSSAAEAGLVPGDQLVALDGQPLARIPLSQRKFLSAGTAGSIVQLRVRAGNGQTRELTLHRELIERPLIESHLLGGVGYIRLRTFSEDLGPRFDAVLAALQRQGARGYVIDLRGNLGGSAAADFHLLSRFVPSGQLAELIGTDGATHAIRADGSSLPDRPPLAVLIDSGSLSASELFASDIQQFHVGTIVGARSPGCLLGSEFLPLSDGSALQVSDLNVLAGPGGVRVNHVGVIPNDEVSLTAADLAAGRDPQLQRAITHVQAMIGP